MKKILIIFFILVVHSQILANNNQDSSAGNNISEQLKNLKDLYISGALSGYEYEEEKKKILNK